MASVALARTPKTGSFSGFWPTIGRAGRKCASTPEPERQAAVTEEPRIAGPQPPAPEWNLR